MLQLCLKESTRNVNRFMCSFDPHNVSFWFKKINTN